MLPQPAVVPLQREDRAIVDRPDIVVGPHSRSRPHQRSVRVVDRDGIVLTAGHDEITHLNSPSARAWAAARGT